MKLSKRDKTFNFVNGTLLTLFAMACLYPFIYVTVISFNDAVDASKGGLYLWPRIFTLANYKALFMDNAVINGFAISIARVFFVVILHLFFTVMFCYPMTKPKFRLKKFLSWWILIPMYFSGGLIPFYIVIKYLHLMNNFWVYVIPSIFVPFDILIVMTAMRNLPASLEESASLDGASEPVILFKIITPMLKPVLAAIALFSGVGAWNDWYTGATFISSQKLLTEQNVLMNLLQSLNAANLARLAAQGKLKGTQVSGQSLQMAMLVVTTLPIVCIYPLLQQYFVKGLLIGSIKG